jgi:hypothetical protein
MRGRSWTIGVALSIGGLACGGGGSGGGTGTGPATPIAYTSQSAPPSGAPTAASPSSNQPQSLQDICAGVQTADAKVTNANASPSIDNRALRSVDSYAKGGALAEDDGSATKAKAKQYKMIDLRALQASGNWEELLGHIEDIQPRQRGPEWDDLLVKSATGLLSSLTSKSDAFSGFWLSESLVKRYTQLQSSKEFMAKRAEVGKTVFQQCFTQSSTGLRCVERAKDFLAVGDKDRDLDFAIARIVRRTMHPYTAVPFFRLALESTKDGSSCGDDDLRVAVLAGLANMLPKDDEAIGARDIAANMCWTALKDPIEAQLKQNPSAKVNTCSVLKAKGEVQ